MIHGGVLHSEALPHPSRRLVNPSGIQVGEKSGYNYLSLLEPKLYLNTKYYFYRFNTVDFLGIRLPRNQEKRILCVVRSFTRSV